jgi:hypothetical protein
MPYACLLHYGDDRELPQRVRPSLAGLLERGGCVAAGSFVPADDGGLFLYNARDHAKAEAIVALARGGGKRNATAKGAGVHAVVARGACGTWEPAGRRVGL